MSVYVVGDTHGSILDTNKLSNKRFKATEDDVVIQLGDFGWVWYPIGTNKEQEYWLDNLANKPYSLYVVLGNHENYDIIFNLPLEYIDEVQGLCYVLKRSTGNIYFFERGGIYTIQGKTFLCIGGALSIDREYRNDGTSWWHQEYLSYTEELKCLTNLDKHNWEVDFMLTHTCPTSQVSNFTIDDYSPKYDDKVASFIHKIVRDKRFKCPENHFGHFHLDKIVYNNDMKFQCHYHNSPFKII
jgi:predicted phosphodiesterase